MPHHGLKGHISHAKGRGERHNDDTSLRNHLHVFEIDKVRWRSASHNNQGVTLLERYIRRAVYQIAARPTDNGRQRTRGTRADDHPVMMPRATGRPRRHIGTFMHHAGVLCQSSGGYPTFGLKDPFRTHGDYQVYSQIGHGDRILQNGLRQWHPACAVDSKDKAMYGFFFSVTLSAYRTVEHDASCRHELTLWRADGRGYRRHRLDDFADQQHRGFPNDAHRRH